MNTNLLTDFIQDIADGNLTPQYAQRVAKRILLNWDRMESDNFFQELATDVINEVAAEAKVKKDHGINGVARQKDVQSLQKQVDLIFETMHPRISTLETEVAKLHGY